ncbi:MAG TPA: DUF1549 domain-containing protein [Myxococcaceae bacterium]|nr:DUF1549 domain-containing protein [Myxococcaceae bacterium]
MTGARGLTAAALAILVGGAVFAAVRPTSRAAPGRVAVPPQGGGAVDAALQTHWKAQGLTPAAPADDLAVLRRLTLALMGTVPSLEEIRRFEADATPGRLDRWAAALLDDPRSHRYLAERLARVFAGSQAGAFVVYRRDLLMDWLAERLARREPFDAMVRELVSSEGLWTGSPEVNFITAAVVDGKVDEDQLAARTARAFLGVRMDCAQCHDHPFADWKQAQFKGLAAFYGGLKPSPLGLERKPGAEPRVPFGAEWMPEQGRPRERLAAWLTDPRNPHFARATANRVWGLMFGRPFVEPVDDVPPAGTKGAEALDLLADDFARTGYDWRRLVLAVASSKAFRASSELPEGAPRAAMEKAWAVFPVTPLRPEQLIGGLLQAGSVRTIDRDSDLVTRVVRALREKSFVAEYGDPGADELAERPATIAQALLRMNNKLPDEVLDPNPFTATGRIALMAGDAPRALEVTWLALVTRRPTEVEREKFLPWLAEARGGERGKVLGDLAWALFNSAEFSWNH